MRVSKPEFRAATKDDTRNRGRTERDLLPSSFLARPGHYLAFANSFDINHRAVIKRSVSNAEEGG